MHCKGFTPPLHCCQLRPDYQYAMRYRCIILSTLLAGCSAVNVAHLQDAETLPVGKGAANAMVAAGPNLLFLMQDTTAQRTLWKSLDPIVGVGGRYGVADGFDIGGNAWSANIPLISYPITYAADIGLEADARVRLTPLGSRHNVAVTAGASGYYALVTKYSLHEDAGVGYGGTWGIGGGAIYSYALDDPAIDRTMRSSLYAGIHINRLQSDYIHPYLTPGWDTLANAPRFETIRHDVVFSPFAGMRLPHDRYIEVSALLMNDPVSNKLNWGLYLALALWND